MAFFSGGGSNESIKNINLGSGTNFNIKTLYPDYYSSLSLSNFYIAVTGISLSGSASGGAEGKMYSDDGGDSSIDANTGASSSTTPTLSYNPTTGALTVSGTNTSCSNSGSNTSGSVTGKCSLSASASISFQVHMLLTM